MMRFGCAPTEDIVAFVSEYIVHEGEEEGVIVKKCNHQAPFPPRWIQRKRLREQLRFRSCAMHDPYQRGTCDTSQV